MLEVKELAVAVENHIIVRRASIKVVEGEVNVLMGPSIFGKTSLSTSFLCSSPISF